MGLKEEREQPPTSKEELHGETKSIYVAIEEQ